MATKRGSTRKSRIQHGWPLAAMLLTAVGGCPNAASNSQSTADPELAALLTSPVVSMPEVGVASLANTTWRGEWTCIYSGALFVSPQQNTPMTNSISFDANGLPFRPGYRPGDMIGTIAGSDWTAENLRRADFSPTSFSLGWATEGIKSQFETAPGEGGLFGSDFLSHFGQQSMVIVEAQLSQDGSQLIGRQVMELLPSVQNGPLHLTVKGRIDCTFTLTKESR